MVPHPTDHRPGAAMLARVGGMLSVCLLAGCEPGVLGPVGPVAAGERTLLINAFLIMMTVIVPVIVLTLVFAWWFRAGNGKARFQPEFTYSGRLELLVWSIPTLIVIFVGGLAWIGSHELDPPRALRSTVKPIRVDVVALDWKWLFIYPDQGIASVNHLVVPAGTPVSFRLTSATVMNSLSIPRLGGQIYAMSGMTTKLNLMADQPGQYRGFSAHYSGRGFPGMVFKVDALRAGGFEQWAAKAGTGGPPLDGAHFAELTKDSENVRPYTYHAVPTGLFDRIVQNSGTLSAKTAVDGREQ